MPGRPGQRPENLPGGPPASEPDLVDQLVDLMAPAIEDVLGRIEGADAFTTSQFIDLLLTDPAGHAVYDEAMRRWGESERYSKMVIHGQVIPQALRRSRRVEWGGYAYGEPDEFAIPAWWNLTGAS